MMHPVPTSPSSKRGAYSLLGSLSHGALEEEEADIGVMDLQLLDPNDYKVLDNTDEELILPYEYEVARERALVRKLDRRLMPCLFAMIVLKYAHLIPESTDSEY
jgi:hypothetical protein